METLLACLRIILAGACRLGRQELSETTIRLFSNAVDRSEDAGRFVAQAGCTVSLEDWLIRLIIKDEPTWQQFFAALDPWTSSEKVMVIADFRQLYADLTPPRGRFACQFGPQPIAWGQGTQKFALLLVGNCGFTREEELPDGTVRLTSPQGIGVTLKFDADAAPDPTHFKPAFGFGANGDPEQFLQMMKGLGHADFGLARDGKIIVVCQAWGFEFAAFFTTDAPE